MRNLLLALVLVSQPALSATYVVNGDFSDSTGFVANDPSGGMMLHAGSTAIPGWTVTGGSVLWIGPDGLAESSPLRGIGLVNAVLLRDEADSILQLIDDLPELLSFEAAGTVQSTDRDRVRDALDVLVGGTEASIPTRSGSTAPVRWSVSFSARGGRVPLLLSGITDPTNSYVVVDDVSVAPPGAAVLPEPGSWALMLIGFGAIGAAMRSRREVAVSFG